MRTWNDKLRNATESLLTVVTTLHESCEDAHAIRLANTISDISQLLTQLDADHRALERELQREKGKSEMVLARVEALERLYRGLEREASVPVSQSAEGDRDVSVHSRGLSEERKVGGGVMRAEDMGRGAGVGEGGMRDDGQASSVRCPPGTPPRPHPSSPPLKTSISPYRAPLPKELPALPTLEEIQAEQRERRSRKRALAAQRPPPCEKCRLRKRAMMLREHGFVKEDVFMRWSKRPGACLQFMHYDEPVPPGVESALSFPETETQSPKG